MLTINDTHTTDECKTLENMISNGNHSNKSWKRSDNDNSNSDKKKELAAMKLRKIVRKETRRELHALQKSKKRKQDLNNVEKDTVDDDDFLKEFDDVDLENLDMSQFE